MNGFAKLLEVLPYRRGTGRHAPGALVDPSVIGAMWRQFADLGALEPHAIDSSTLTLEQTVARVRAVVNDGSKRLTG